MRKMVFSRLPLLVLLVLVGCAGQQFATRGDVGAPSNAGAEKGIALLAEGRAKQANAEFNRALARAPSDSNLHFLNGLSYSEQVHDHGEAVSDLAESGYRLALEFDPNNWLAAWHLGLQQVEQRQYTEARKSLAKAVQLRPRNPDIQLALAGSAYLASDVPVALWAAENTLALRPSDPEALRIAALSSAALGIQSDAHGFLERFRAVRPAQAEFLDDRIHAWEDTYAQASVIDSNPNVTAPSKPADPSNGMPTVTPQDRSPAGAPGGGSTIALPVDPGPLAAAWNDCIQSAANTQAASSYGGGNNSGWGGGSLSDGTERLVALPSPCKGMPLPRMAVLDATLIRTQDTTEYRQGVNLLDGLKIVLGGNWERTHQSTLAGGNTRSTSITRSLGLPQGGITYSLNIFNAQDTTAEVIARPSLLALDRTPSTFFSGQSVSVAMVGQYGGSMADRNIGVSLSVTPTFIDDDHLLLTVKAARSFIEPTQFAGFDQALTLSNNTVFANVIMGFGETLILSGLRERETEKSKDGVPLLRDLPVLQYLFSAHTDFDYDRHVMILITPRRPSTFSEMDRAAHAYISAPGYQVERDDMVSTQALVALGARRSNFEAILAKIHLNRYQNEFRTGDLSARRFAPHPSLERVLQDVKHMLYF